MLCIRIIGPPLLRFMALKKIKSVLKKQNTNTILKMTPVIFALITILYSAIYIKLNDLTLEWN